MTTYEKLKTMLGDADESSHPLHPWWQRFFLFCCGWVWITRDGKGEELSAWLASHEESHQRMDGPCYAADFDEEDRSSAVYESALSMWPVRNAAKAARIVELIRAQVDRAYALFARKRR